MAKSQRAAGFGCRLKALREAAGLTREELGRLAGVSPQTVARYERGANEPSGPAVLDLASALGTTAAAFEVQPTVAVVESASAGVFTGDRITARPEGAAEAGPTGVS